MSEATWASCNLGVFFCMTCSGIQRSLGVHISFVKSVELDLWTMKDVEALQRIGNQAATEEWLARCKDDVRQLLNKGPPHKTWMQGNIKAREFYIRAKYGDPEYAKKDIITE